MARAATGRAAVAPAGRLRSRAPYLAYRVGSAVANALPAPLVRGVAANAGRASALVMPARRAMITRHLQRVYGPTRDEREVRRAAGTAFASYGRYWAEAFRVPTMTPADLDEAMTSWEGVGHLDDALAAGRGAIAAMPHLGGWDLGGAWLASRGFPLTVVVEALQPPELFDWFVELRRRMGLTVVPHGPGVGPAVLRALRANEVAGLLCDRDLTGRGVGVEFFGERTTLPAGPATLALRTGAPLIPTAVYFRGAGHHGVVRPPLPVERTGSLRADVARVTQLLAVELEALVRHAPEQWHLFQPNWPSDREDGP